VGLNRRRRGACGQHGVAELWVCAAFAQVQTTFKPISMSVLSTKGGARMVDKRLGACTVKGLRALHV
jgi:hypothetical protein